jgi:hypothetical protein
VEVCFEPIHHKRNKQVPNSKYVGDDEMQPHTLHAMKQKEQIARGWGSFEILDEN